MKREYIFLATLVASLVWFGSWFGTQTLQGSFELTGLTFGEQDNAQPDHSAGISKPEETTIGENSDERTSTVGFPKLVFQHVIPGSKVVAKPIRDRTQAVIVRIVETYPHGSDFRYDIEYKGLEPGSFDLSKYLVREDSSADPIPPIEVKVNALLEKGEVLPYELPSTRSGFRSYYLAAMLAGGAAWIGGLLLILFYGRGKDRRPESQHKRLTVAERMRPLVDAAVAGELTTQQKAELERVLSAYWSRKLRLDHLSANDLRVELRKHPEGSLMLRQIDSWLHRPSTDPANQVDVNEFLKPYQSMDYESLS